MKVVIAPMTADDSTIGEDLVSAEMFLEGLGCTCKKPNDTDALFYCVLQKNTKNF